MYSMVTRYMATILGGSKNPHRVAVMSDVTNAILKQHASESERGAKYWDQVEQEQRLVAAYDKWALNRTVWSVASEKAKQPRNPRQCIANDNPGSRFTRNNLHRHVPRGCLQRSRQDIMSDGSRIEGCHKAWNMLQKLQPSGIVMLTTLSHDFIHRQNIHIGFQCHEKTPFIASMAGSHHTGIIDAIAKLYNRLRMLDPKSALVPLPELQFINSGETFGLVPSEHIMTFGGLVKEEVNEFQVDAALFQVNSQGDTSGNHMDTTVECQAIQSSQDFIFNELNIDPKLLELPQVLSQPSPHSLRSPDVMPSAIAAKRKTEEPPHMSLALMKQPKHPVEHSTITLGFR